MSTEPASEKLMRSRCRLMTRSPWYGHIAMSIEWKQSDMGWVEDEQKRTIGLRITSQGVVQGFYYPDWVDKSELRVIYGTIEHAINHLIRLHTLRSGGREEEAWAIATDMSVNGPKNNPYIGYREEDGGAVILPHPDMIFIPRGWAEGESAETYYELLMKESQQQQGQGQGKGKGKGQSQGQGGGQGQGDEDDEDQDGQGQGDGDGEGQDGEGDGEGQGQGGGRNRGGKPGEYQHGKFHGHCVDDHNVWDQSDISQDEARQIVHDMAKEATEKSQGYIPGHLKQVIDQLAKPIIRWREILRQWLGVHVGNRRKTYSRGNRRIQEFGIKGVSHHAAATVNVIIDTSGSIGTQELEQFFAEIEAISARAKVMVLQWDAQFQGFDKYRRGDWKKLTVNGRGGTSMSGAFKWLDENNQIADVQVLLTDGYTDWPAPRQYPTMFVITTPEQQTPSPEWGTVVRMQVHQ